MVESLSVSEGAKELSAEARLCLIQTLNALPKTQFEELVFALNPPNGNIPSDSAPQGSRSTAILEWAESPVGPGLHHVEKFLSKIIATHAKTAEQYLAFVISGRISPSTAAEVQAFVKLLRKKTGDDSIDIAFFQKGSIKLILTGSPEGLTKLQEMFEAGELEQLEIPPIEAVNSVDSSSQDARKARLIQALSLRGQSSVTRDLASDSTLVRARVRALKRGLVHTLDSTLDSALDSGLVRALDSARVRALDSTLRFARVLVHIPDYKLRGADLSRTNLYKLRGADLSGANLSGANLSGANLRDINLAGIDLTGADLTYADVTGTIFGANPGLTEADKRDLQNRGAIFLDPPSSDVPALVLR